MAKNLEISVLLDYYGQMLTEKQLEVAQLYYNEDLSLAEIAQFANITRQGSATASSAPGNPSGDGGTHGSGTKVPGLSGKIDQITDCAKEIAFEAEKVCLGQTNRKRSRKDSGACTGNKRRNNINSEWGNTDGI